MAKKSKEEEVKVEEGKEWRNLLGSPSFKRLENGRFKCVQTGHEVPSHGKDSYAQTKHCRLGLIDSALSKNKAPLNMFHQDPLSRSKLICKLTGDIVNKSEEHIWKHIHGKRFLNELEKKEAEELTPNRKVEEPSEQAQEKISKPKAEGLKKKKKKKKPEQNVGELISEGDRWDSGSDSGLETEDAKGADAATEADKKVAGELSKRRKRKSKEIEASNIASSKKKKKKTKSV